MRRPVRPLPFRLLLALLLALLLGGCGRAPLLGETSVSAVDPARGAPGDEITVTGTGFYRDDGGGLEATVCGRPLLDLEFDGERRVVTIPPAGRIDVVVGTTLRGRLADDAVPGPSDVAVTLPRGERIALADAFVCEDDAPTIERFESGSATAATGAPVRFGWTVAAADGSAALRCSFDPGDGSAPSVLEPCSPEGTLEHVYTAAGAYRVRLVADAGGATSDAEVAVTIGAPPSIPAFAAAPELIAAGESAELNWRVAGDGDVTLELEPGPGDVSGLERVAVTPTATTTYTLRAHSPFGEAEARATVTVRTLPAATDDGPLFFATGAGATAAGSLLDNDDLGGPAATLASFGGGDLGGSVADHAAGSSVPLAGGTLTVNADGRVSLAAPAAIGSYTFGYRLTNAAGSSDATVTVTVQSGPAAADDGPYDVDIGGDLTVAATDPDDLLDNDTLGAPAATLASFGGGDLGGTVTDNAAGSGVAFAGGTLTVNADGSFRLEGPTVRGEASFGYRIENANGSSDATVTVRVRAAPVAAADALVAVVGSDFAADLTADNGSSADDLGYPAATLASFGSGDLGGTVTDNAAGSGVPLAGGTLTVAADGGLALTGATKAGSYTFDYRLSNAVGSSDATVTVTVPSAPSAGDDLTGATSAPGGPLHAVFDTTLDDSDGYGSLLGNDGVGVPAAQVTTIANVRTNDGAGTLANVAAGPFALSGGNATVAPLPGYGDGSLTVNADGTFEVTPPSGYSGLLEFDYTLANPLGSDSATVRVAFGARPAAVADAYAPALVGNVAVDTSRSSGFSVLANDAGDALSAELVGAAGGDATLAADGTFGFVSDAGYEGAATISYRVRNGFGVGADASVALTVSDTVWFVDAAAPAGGDGRQGSPFAALVGSGGFTDAAGGGSAGDVVYLAGGSYSAGVTLPDDQIWVGAGSSVGFTAATGLALPADSVAPATGGAAPVLATTGGDALTLGENLTLRGFAVGDTGGYALADGGAGVGTLTIRDLDVSGSGGALRLANGGTLDAVFGTLSASGASASPLRLVGVGGSLSATDGSLAHAGGDALVAIDGGSVAVTYPGALTMSGSGPLLSAVGSPGGNLAFGGALSANAGGGVVLSGTGGSVAFGGTVTLSGTSGGVTLTNATGAVSFADLDVSASGGAAIVASGSRLRIDAGDVRCSGADAGGYCLDLSNVTSDGVALTSFGADRAGAAGGGVRVLNGSGSVVIPTVTGVVASGASAVLVDGPGLFSFGTASAGPLSASGAPALDLRRAALDVRATTLASTGSSSYAVRVADATGARLTIGGAVTIGDPNGRAVLLSDLTGGGTDISVADGSTVTVTGRRGAAIELARVAGRVDVGAVTVGSSSDPGYGALLRDSSAAVAFDALNVAGVPGSGEGLDPDGFPTATGTGDGLHASGLSGSLTVAGGTLEDLGDDGVDLRDVASATFTGVTVRRSGGQAVEAQRVAGLTLDGASLVDCGDDTKEGCLRGRDLSGTLTVVNSTLELAGSSGRNAEWTLYLLQRTGALAIDVDGSVFAGTDRSSRGQDGFQVITTGASTTVDLDVASSTFRDNRTNGLQLLVEGGARATAVIGGSSFVPYGGGSVTVGRAIDLAAIGTSTLGFRVENNPTLHANGGTVVNAFAGDSATVDGRIANNPDIRTVGGSTAGFGVAVRTEGASDSAVEIEGNTVVTTGFDGGVHLRHHGTGGSRLDATVAGNSVTVATDAIADLYLDGRNGATLCADLRDNDASGAAAFGSALLAQNDATNPLLLDGFASDLASTWAGNGNTPAGDVDDATGSVPGAGTCQSPTLP